MDGRPRPADDLFRTVLFVNAPFRKLLPNLTQHNMSAQTSEPVKNGLTSSRVTSRHMYNNKQSLELGVRHTLAFVVFASAMLLLLFFFNLSLAVTLLFCISATTATGTVAVLPLMRRARSMLVDYGVIWNGEFCFFGGASRQQPSLYFLPAYERVEQSMGTAVDNLFCLGCTSVSSRSLSFRPAYHDFCA